MIFPALTWLLLLLAAALCAVGFYKFTYFSTVGHGLAVAGLGLAVLAVAFSRGKGSLIFILSCILCLLYGLFQGGLAGLAEWLRISHRRILKTEAESNTPLYVSIGYWILLSLAYVMAISPLWYRAASGVGKDSIFSWLGLILMAAGVLIILLAHRQARRQREEDAQIPPMGGIYTWARCPGQLGRLFFWTGMLLSGVGYVSGSQWIVAVLGYALAVFLSIRSARRQDGLTRRRYSYLPEYREYAEDTHILVPLMMPRKISW